MPSVQKIDDDHAVGALADHLNGRARTRPVVVVTIPAARYEPWIDVEEVAREAGDLAEVYLLPTGALTWAFTHQMPEGTQVYGGAGRVYPVGHAWATDLSAAPLRFALSTADGERVTQQLISDALRMAAAAGLLNRPPCRELREVTGSVSAVVAHRALVDVGNPLPATIAGELTVADVPIDRILQAGQRVAGKYDATTNRIDVSAHLRGAEDALAAYAVGDVVLTRVTSLHSDRAELLLYPATTGPAVTSTVLRSDVTTNPLDDLRTLMTLGEVIPARVVATGLGWSLSLTDVDDDEPIATAPSLLAGGPPWLVEESPEAHDDDVDELWVPIPRAPSPVGEPVEPVEPGAASEPAVAAVEPAGVVPKPGPPPGAPKPGPPGRAPKPCPPGGVPTPAPLTPGPPAQPAAPAATSAPTAPRPTPALLDRNRARSTAVTPPVPAPGPGTRPVPSPTPATRPQPAPVPAPPSESTRALLLKIDNLRAEVGALARGQEALRTQLRAGEDERDQLRYLLLQAERRANRAEHDLKAARQRLRKASKARPLPPVEDGPRFADPEEGFRYLVLTQWATRTLPDEQATRPLPDYRIGPAFLDSLDRLEGIKTEKVADVVFEILTGLAATLPSRELHRLRTGPGGDDPVRTREDGAVAWRASLQVKSPSARRIHYWALPDGRIELARVATHDEFDA